MELDFATVAPYLEMGKRIGFMWGTVLTSAAILVALIIIKVRDSRESKRESDRKLEETRMRLICYKVLDEVYAKCNKGQEPQPKSSHTEPDA